MCYVHTFHNCVVEMKSDVRDKAALIVLRRGCAPIFHLNDSLVLTDSNQRGDLPALDPYIGNFEKVNLVKHFGELTPMNKMLRSTTISLTSPRSGG